MIVPFRIEHCVILPDPLRIQVYRLLEECGDEFVPPLSQRVSTRQSDLVSPSSQASEGVKSYFEEMVQQRFLLARSSGDGQLLAFLSYIPSYQLPCCILDKMSSYVSTICTTHTARGMGIARALYMALESFSESDVISLRTWSTNTAQMHLLGSLGYREIHKIPNDRGHGIDTLYYMKEVDCNVSYDDVESH